jgi:hypothetical protein
MVKTTSIPKTMKSPKKGKMKLLFNKIIVRIR